MTQAKIASDAASFFVVPAGGGRSLIDVNADRSQNPASLIKLITTAAALDLLGPAYTWRTQLLATGAVNAGVLDGDLYVRASGDPKFVDEQLVALLRDLRVRSIREIRGDLVVDRSVFAPTVYDEARFDGDPKRAYNVAPDAWLVKFKATAFRFIPVDDRVEVGMEPHGSIARLSADVKAVDGPCGDWRAAIRAEFDDPEHPRFSGHMPRACGARTWFVNLASRDVFARQTFEQTWAELGGATRSGFTVREGPVPNDARVLAESLSPPLAEVIRDINKYSNNVMARQLYLTLGAEMSGQAATRERAEIAVRSWAEARGIDVSALVLDNGSGLSRDERVTARLLARVLTVEFLGATMPEFISSLPIVGVDGTMRRRVISKAVAGAAHIKTGSLNDVRGIAGYVLAASGKRYVVVSIVNGPHAAQAQPVHDALLQWVAERG